MVPLLPNHANSTQSYTYEGELDSAHTKCALFPVVPTLKVLTSK